MHSHETDQFILRYSLIVMSMLMKRFKRFIAKKKGFETKKNPK